MWYILNDPRYSKEYKDWIHICCKIELLFIWYILSINIRIAQWTGNPILKQIQSLRLLNHNQCWQIHTLQNIFPTNPNHPTDISGVFIVHQHSLLCLRENISGCYSAQQIQIVMVVLTTIKVIKDQYSIQWMVSDKIIIKKQYPIANVKI